MKEIKERIIQDTVEEFKRVRGDWRKIHERLKTKRLAWFETHGDNLNLSGTLPKQAYQMLLLEYRGFDEEEVPIVEETEAKITWRS